MASTKLKLNQIESLAASSILGTSSAGSPVALTIGAGLSLIGTDLQVTNAASLRKGSVTLATTAALTITARSSTTLSIGATTLTVDGVAVVNGGTVLVKNNTTGVAGAGDADNGVYVVSGVGTAVVLTRADWMNDATEIDGVYVLVEDGTLAGTLWFTVSEVTTLGTDTILFTQIATSGTGISTLNTLTASAQTFAVGSSGSDFNIDSPVGGSTHTFNIPNASLSSRGLLTSADFTTFNNKISAFGSQTQKFVFAAPSGADGVPTFRALLAADIPAVTNVAGGVLGSVHYQSAANATAMLAGNTTTTKQFLTQTGTGTVSAAPAWGTIVVGDLPTVTAVKGGTGITSYTAGDLLQASDSTTLAKLAAVGTGNVLISGGVGQASSWGKVGLTTHITGTLPFANGGTGLAAATQWGILYAPSTSSLAYTVAGTAGQFLKANSSAAPSWSDSFTITKVYLTGSTATSLTLNSGNPVTTVDGTATNFNVPTTNVDNVFVVRNGLLLSRTGTVTRDYTLVGQVLTFATALTADENVLIYKYE